MRLNIFQKQSQKACQYHRYMCLNIIGTADQVKTRRMMNSIRDYLYSDNDCIAITSGSLGEGLAMRGSDFDKM